MSHVRVLSIVLLLLAPNAEAGRKQRKQKAAEAPAAFELSPDAIVLPCEWPVGTTFTFEHSRRREDTREPMLAQVTTTWDQTTTIVEAGNPMVVVFDLGSPRFEGPEEAVAQVRGTMESEEAIPALQLVVRDGSITDLANRGEIVAAMEPIMRRMMAQAPPEALESALAMMRDPATGTALLLQDAQIFFSMHCVALSEGQVFETATAFPNPFGGAPIAGTSRVALADYDEAAGTVTFETRDAVDRGAIESLLPAILERFAPGRALDAAQLKEVLDQLPPIETVTTGTMVYAVADGFPLEIRVRRDVGAPGHPLRKTDTWSWTRTSPR